MAEERELSAQSEAYLRSRELLSVRSSGRTAKSVRSTQVLLSHLQATVHLLTFGGVFGMIHISELSWTHIKHPSEVVNVGDTVEVYVKDINEETKKISLGFKNADEIHGRSSRTSIRWAQLLRLQLLVLHHSVLLQTSSRVLTVLSTFLRLLTRELKSPLMYFQLAKQ